MKVLVMNCSPVRNGATAEIVSIVFDCLKTRNEVRNICIDDFSIGFCQGCRNCHNTVKCVQHDDVDKIMEQYRCTPWCDTHEPHATIGSGKKGYSIALRTGSSMRECNRIIESIEHFYGHMEIECCDKLGLCSVEYKESVEQRRSEIMDFCNKI